MKFVIQYKLVLLCILIFASFGNAQPANLLKNPNADFGASDWRVYGDASVEQTDDGNSRFVVRNKGSFLQDVILPPDSIGKYALFIGRVSSERINTEGAITGLPYLYGYMMVDANPRGGRILAYLQGQEMLSSSTKANEWVTAWGVFQIPAGSGAIRFFLNQAERKDLHQNGSAARFDDLGLYIFTTRDEVSAFVKTYKAIAPVTSPTPTMPKAQLPQPPHLTEPSLQPALEPPSYPQDRSGRVFTARQVDQKAFILAKPEAKLTEAALRHYTFGTVIVSVVLAANGKVTRIKLVKGLGNGLNENAMAAASQIKFRPAIRRGLFVATSREVEYNFNPY